MTRHRSKWTLYERILLSEISLFAILGLSPVSDKWSIQSSLNITYMICGSHLFGTVSFIAHHLLQDSLANKITRNFKFFQYLFIYLLLIYLFIYLYSLKLSIFDQQPAICILQPATCNLQPANYTLRLRYWSSIDQVFIETLTECWPSINQDNHHVANQDVDRVLIKGINQHSITVAFNAHDSRILLKILKTLAQESNGSDLFYIFYIPWLNFFILLTFLTSLSKGLCQ